MGISGVGLIKLEIWHLESHPSHPEKKKEKKKKEKRAKGEKGVPVNEGH